MKSMCESQIAHLCVESILSWKGTDGQCLAALHFHISALKPDQADSTLSGEKRSRRGASGADLISEKSAINPKTSECG
jgi:hypothetical protein